MGFLTKIEDKILPGRRKQALRTAPPVRPYVESAVPGIPWNEPVGTVPLVGPIELEAPVLTRIQGRVIEDNGFMLPDRTPDRRLVKQRRPLDAETRPTAERERLERSKAEQRAEKRIAERKDNASTPNIRRLRQLIREKYRLDVYVWNKRSVQRAMRPRIQEHATRADAILQEISFIVNEWDKDAFDDPEEWKLAKKIKDGLMKGGSQHLLWGDLPAWEREEDGDYSEHQAEDRPENGRNNRVPWA